MVNNILDILEKAEKKLTNEQIAQMIGSNEQEVSDIIKGLEKENISVGYKTRINWEKTDRAMVKALIELRVPAVKVLCIHIILCDTERLAEALVMHDLALAQEFDGVAHVGIIGQAQDVVIGHARLLLGGKILHQVGNGIALGLQGGGGKGRSRGGGGIDAKGVIHEIFIKAACLDFGRG